MKRLITMLMLMVAMGTMCMAKGDTVHITLPCDTVRVVSSDYSSGGGDKPIVYIEVLVEKTDGTYEMYLDSKMSTSGLLGFGRFTMPSSFEYIIDESNTVRDRIVVEW